MRQISNLPQYATALHLTHCFNRSLLLQTAQRSNLGPPGAPISRQTLIMKSVARAEAASVQVAFPQIGSTVINTNGSSATWRAGIGERWHSTEGSLHMSQRLPRLSKHSLKCFSMAASMVSRKSSTSGRAILEEARRVRRTYAPTCRCRWRRGGGWFLWPWSASWTGFGVGDR